MAGVAEGPDEKRLRAWRSFLRAYRATVDQLADELEDEAHLPLGWYDVLLNLHEAGGRLRMQELAEAVLLSKSGLTRLVDRMAEAGLLGREACPGDRRGTYAVLTPAGYQRLRAAAPVHLRGVDEHFGRLLSDEEAELLARVLARVADRA